MCQNKSSSSCSPSRSFVSQAELSTRTEELWVPKEKYQGDGKWYGCEIWLDMAQCRKAMFNPLGPGIKLQILLLCFHTFLTEVVGRSC